jgi:hypothetical protein
MRAFAAVGQAARYDAEFKDRQDKVNQDTVSKVEWLWENARRQNTALLLLTDCIDKQGAEIDEVKKTPTDERHEAFKDFEEYLISQKDRN